MAWQRDRSDNRKRGGGRGGFDDFGGPSSYEPRAPRADFGAAPRGVAVQQANVTAVVKWFNPTKGFGFVSPNDGSPDAFLHISALERAGQQSVPEGTTITCDLGQGQRGPQVVTVHDIDTSTATAPAPRAAGPRESFGGPAETVEGRVKFFSADKGFGFVAVDTGGKDVFVHVKALERSGLRTLEPEQRVRLTVSMGHKGPQAESIALI